MIYTKITTETTQGQFEQIMADDENGTVKIFPVNIENTDYRVYLESINDDSEAE